MTAAFEELEFAVLDAIRWLELTGSNGGDYGYEESKRIRLRLQAALAGIRQEEPAPKSDSADDFLYNFLTNDFQT